MTSRTTNKFSPEVLERAVRLILDHEGDHSSRWTACLSIATKIGCSAHTLLDWVKRAEIDAGKRAGLPTDMAEKMKALERENRELRQANEILRKASAYFAQAERIARGVGEGIGYAVAPEAAVGAMVRGGQLAGRAAETAGRVFGRGDDLAAAAANAAVGGVSGAGARVAMEAAPDEWDAVAGMAGGLAAGGAAAVATAAPSAVRAAGRFTSRTFRSFMATRVRSLPGIRVDREQRQLWLGHLGQDTTAHYEIADSEYLREAAAATDAIIREIDKHSRRDLWPKPTTGTP